MKIEYLYPGDIFISNLHKKVVTILGSCIAVVLYSQKFGIGGINHGMFPRITQKSNFKNDYKTDTIYIDFSINTMLMLFKDYGIKTHEITAKVFGGADILKNDNINLFNNKMESVGKINTRTAFEVLNENNIPVINHDTGGVKGRKIIFYTDTGEVFLKYLNKITN